MAVQNFYIYKLCWLNLQGSITFPPQQMPHASTYIKIEPLECWGEMSQRQCARRSCWRLVGLDLDGGIGASNFYRKLEASWMMNNRDFVALIHSIWEVLPGIVAQIKQLCLS